VPSILTLLEPLVRTLLDRHLAAAAEWFPHQLVPYEAGRAYGQEPWRPEESPFSPAVRTALQLNLLTEDNLPYYHLALARAGDQDGAWGEWTRRWTAEEARHAIVLRDFLTVTRAVDPVALERERMAHVSHGYYPVAADNPLDGLVYVTLQELATRIAHRNTGLASGDPVAERILTRVALDENLHFAFYRDLACGALELDASAMVLAMHRQVIGFAMPGAALPGFRRRALRVAAAGIYDLRIHHDQVLSPVVLTHFRLRSLVGLSDQAEIARDALLAFLAGLDAGTAPSASLRQSTAPGHDALAV
jgi:acyl-[acyl-carrier-protein] desaturase